MVTSFGIGFLFEVLGFTLFIAFIFEWIFTKIKNVDIVNSGMFAMLLSSCVFFVIAFFCHLYHTINVPTAEDVYKHKTCLSITYENGVPTDTIVVFKK